MMTKNKQTGIGKRMIIFLLILINCILIIAAIILMHFDWKVPGFILFMIAVYIATNYQEWIDAETKPEPEPEPKPEPDQIPYNLPDERMQRIREKVQEEDFSAYKYQYESETQSKSSYDYVHIQHVLARVMELGQGEKLLCQGFLDLCTRMNKEYERVGKDLATAITNHYLKDRDYPTPEVLAAKTGISQHYCYLMLQEYQKQVGRRIEKMAGEKGVTAHDILYKTETITDSVSTGKIIGYEEVPYTSCRTLMEESCYMNTGGHYEYRKEPIYEFKTTQRTVQTYQMDNVRPFVPQTFIKLVSGRWSDLSSSECLDFGQLQFYISQVYPKQS